MDDLESILDELDRLIAGRHPALHARFRPGLSESEIESHARGLRPFHLPAELVVVYRWHDGWRSFADDEYRPLIHDASFPSLAEASRQYQTWLDALGLDGWHPLWFPAFGEQSGELVALQLEPGESAGQVFGFHAELGLSTSYDSVAALFATTLECWRTGLLPYEGPSFPPEIRALIARHNPRSRTAEGAPRREISRLSTEDWPPEWKEVAGIAPLGPPAEDAITVAQFHADPRHDRPVAGDVRVTSGSFDAFRATLADATGSVAFLATRDRTASFREVYGSTRRWQVWLERDGDGYVATRMLPLH